MLKSTNIFEKPYIIYGGIVNHGTLVLKILTTKHLQELRNFSYSLDLHDKCQTSFINTELSFFGKREEILDLNIDDLCKNTHVLCYLGNSKMVQVIDIEENQLKQKEYFNNVGTFGEYGIVNMGFFSLEENSKKI